MTNLPETASKEKLIFDELRGEFVQSSENLFAARWVNLADPRLGAEAIFATDEWFAPKERLIDPDRPVFVPGKYDDNGKWMDGWETRRKRTEGHDFCIVKLGVVGTIKGINLDTSHFTGNYPPAASIEACNVPSKPDGTTKWTEILSTVSLTGHAHHLHPVDHEGIWTHVRLNIYPDGGVARLRVYGLVYRDWKQLSNSGGLIDLIAIENGGWLVGCSDQHYGSPINILYPGTGSSMAQGWETRRRREPGNEWALFRLGTAGSIKRIAIDTTHFKGNYPDRCSLHAGNIRYEGNDAVTSESMFWRLLLPEQKLQMDSLHIFEKEIADLGMVTHVRFNVIPDGGVNRLRLFGIPV
jgi:allantoicase